MQLLRVPANFCRLSRLGRGVVSKEVSMVMMKWLRVLAALVAPFTTGADAQGFPNIRRAQNSLRSAI